MRKLTVSTLPPYDICIERGLLRQAGTYCRQVLPRAKRIFLVTDTNVGPLYGQTVLESLENAGFAVHLETLPAGERTKSGKSLLGLWESMVDFGLTRTDAVAALGGGMTGDLAGFAAATVLRGVDFIQIPTTLLAQVDSSVGGKVAVNLENGKNLAGAFRQPRLVLMDPDVLDSLPDRVFSDGMAEVIKYGCISDREFFDFLASHPDRQSITQNMEHVLETCCDLKRQVVERDEKDTGERMLLNFGHTVGHAFEKSGGYEAWSHGQSVAAGMCAAVRLGAKYGVGGEDLLPPLERLLTAFDLPVSIPCTRQEILQAVGTDKKNAGKEISLIFLERIGKACICKMKQERLPELLAEAEEGTV